MHFWLLQHLRNFTMDRFLAQGYGKLYMLLYMLGYSWFLLWRHFLFPSQLLNISAQVAALNFTFSVWFWSLKNSLNQNVPSRIVALGSRRKKTKKNQWKKKRYCSFLVWTYGRVQIKRWNACGAGGFGLFWEHLVFSSWTSDKSFLLILKGIQHGVSLAKSFALSLDLSDAIKQEFQSACCWLLSPN